MEYCLYIISFLYIYQPLIADDDLYRKVKNKYQNMQFYSAKVESIIAVNEEVSIKLHGNIGISKPDKWKFEIFKDKKLILFNMSDGHSYWKFDKQDQRIIKSSTTSEPELMNFFPAFKTYDETAIKTSLETSAVSIFKIPLKDKTSPFRTVELTIDKQDQVISQIAFKNSSGKTMMKMSFSEISLNKPAGKKPFIFTPIKEYPVKVIKE